MIAKRILWSFISRFTYTGLFHKILFAIIILFFKSLFTYVCYIYGSLFTYIGHFLHMCAAWAPLAFPPHHSCVGNIYRFLFTCIGLFSHIYIKKFSCIGLFSQHMPLFTCIGSFLQNKDFFWYLCRASALLAFTTDHLCVGDIYGSLFTYIGLFRFDIHLFSHIQISLHMYRSLFIWHIPLFSSIGLFSHT